MIIIIRIVYFIRLCLGILSEQETLFDCLVNFAGGMVIMELDNYVAKAFKISVEKTRILIKKVDYDMVDRTIYSVIFFGSFVYISSRLL